MYIKWYFDNDKPSYCEERETYENGFALYNSENHKYVTNPENWTNNGLDENRIFEQIKNDSLIKLNQLAQQQREIITNRKNCHSPERLAYFVTKASMAKDVLNGDAQAIEKLSSTGEHTAREISVQQLAQLILEKHFEVFDEGDIVEKTLAICSNAIESAQTKENIDEILYGTEWVI